MKKSSAKWEDIKTRMTNKKCGFIAVDKVPPQGYDLVYTHKSWNIHPDPITSCIETGQKDPQFDEFKMLFNTELIPFTLLKRQPASVNVWQHYHFSVTHFIKELRSIPELKMSDYDKTYFDILLPAETGTSLDLMPTNALHEFGIRFGPWIRIIEQIRNFVEDGARNWFHGKCDSKQAQEILSTCKSGSEYYLIRSVPVVTELNPDRKYVFAITYRKLDGISHFKIFKDISDRLCMVNTDSEVQYFASFQAIIHATVKPNAEPFPNQYFKGLVTQTVKVIVPPNEEIDKPKAKYEPVQVKK